MSRRDEQREFENDVFYEAWRRGLDPDRAVQCADDCYWDGKTPEDCVNEYQQKVCAARERRQLEEMQQEYPEEPYDA